MLQWWFIINHHLHNLTLRLWKAWDDPFPWLVTKRLQNFNKVKNIFFWRKFLNVSFCVQKYWGYLWCGCHYCIPNCVYQHNFGKMNPKTDFMEKLAWQGTLIYTSVQRVTRVSLHVVKFSNFLTFLLIWSFFTL